LSGETGLPALLYLRRKVFHRLLRDSAAFATRQRSSCVIQSREKFHSLPLTFLPQRKGFLNRILNTIKPASLDGLANESFLIRS
jgi:hypothetical protein